MAYAGAVLELREDIWASWEITRGKGVNGFGRDV